MPVNELISAFLKEGLFAGMFAFILIYFLKENKAKNDIHMEIIREKEKKVDELKNKLNDIEGGVQNLNIILNNYNNQLVDIKILLSTIEVLTTKKKG